MSGSAFLERIRLGFYHRKSSHVLPPGPGAKAQGTGYQFPNEIVSDLSHDHPGAIGLANSGPHTNGSQWYITLGDRSYLDGNLTVFGEVAKRMDVVIPPFTRLVVEIEILADRGI